MPGCMTAEIISYDSSRGGVSVVTEKGDSTTSFLLVQHAKPSDSGQYTCNPSNAQPKSITVHVLNETETDICSVFLCFRRVSCGNAAWWSSEATTILLAPPMPLSTTLLKLLNFCVPVNLIKPVQY
ncbi:Protein of unknown function [Cotesia congregata]|uniref:Ig-like domain-containing protein n=1 Tax=Cotesia congregata TaxID=51543 RepID=A0A8J2HGZ5_COTCN|nr:Protein of unknown function [Cotesia congregata]